MPIRGGAFQIVFCDRGTPSKDPRQFTIYAAIRDELVARGMPKESIAFIHDAVKPADKLNLAQRCRTGGEISVLIGSTEKKMGTGTNVQTRLRALHHVDVPWRPADLEQREGGRIIRQGNQNPEVDIVNYVTEGSYDTVMWQKVEAKARFIEQIKRGEVDIDEIEDLGGGDISDAAAETKAIATGDPPATSSRSNSPTTSNDSPRSNPPTATPRHGAATNAKTPNANSREHTKNSPPWPPRR